MSRRNRRAAAYAVDLDNSYRIDGFTVRRTGISAPGYICTDPNHGRVNKCEILRRGKLYLTCWQCVQQKLNVTEPKLDPAKFSDAERVSLE